MSQGENKASQPGPNMNMNMGMGGLGGPVGMNLNNGAPRAMHAGEDKSLLNTYIYDYFLKNGMIQCASIMFKSGEAELQTIPKDGSRRTSPSRRPQKHDADGNTINGMVDENAMDTDGPARKLEDGEEGSKNDHDLPDAKVPSHCPQQSFLLDWWGLFWDIFHARSGIMKGTPAAAYVNQTQAAQRMRNDQLLRMNPQHNTMMGSQVSSQMLNPPGYPARMMQGGGMMPNGIMHVPDGGDMSKSQLARTAMLNNNRKTPQQMNSLKNHQMMQMQRSDVDVNEMNGQQPRPQSPATGQNAASPGNNKRVRLDNGDYSQVGNGRGPQGVPQGNSQQASQAHQMLVASGINPNTLTQQQFTAFQNQNPGAQQKSIQMYAQSLAAHTGRAVSALQGGPMQKGMPNVQQNPGQHGSPMIPQTSDGAPLDFYTTATPGNSGMRGGSQMPGTSGNHALQDYQMQLMLLEQQNKKRLLLARAEQDNIAHHGEGQRRIEQPASFQGMSPGRPAPSPQPSGNPKMGGTPKISNQVGPVSPLPDSQMPQRNSPAAMAGFSGQMNPDHQNMMYPMKEQLMLGNAGAGNMSGGPMMRPSNPVAQYSNQISQEEMQQAQMNPEMVRAQQAGRGQPASAVWQQPQHQTPTAVVQQQQMQMQQQQQQQQQQSQQQSQQQQPPQAQAQQGQTQQQVGTPQQARTNIPHQSMPPPSVPTNGPATGRTQQQPSSPQVQNQPPPTPTQSHKPAPKGKATRENQKKPRPNKKAPPTSAVSNAVAGTPSSEPPTPTTPSHPNSFSNNGQSHPRQNTNFASGTPGQGNAAGQPPQQPTPNPASAPPPAPTAQSEPVPTPSFNDPITDISLGGFGDFTNDGSDTLLDNFDFDSFLNNPEDGPAALGFDGLQWASESGVEATNES